MDLNSVFETGQGYVMLSRLQCIDQLYIVDELKDEKIRASPAALEELKRLEKISFNRNPSPWHKRNKDIIKIASVNCYGLLPHLRDIRKDWKLLNGDVIQLLETSLPVDIDTEDITINRYAGKFVNVGNGKGIASFVKENIDCKLKDEVIKPTLQIVKLDLGALDSISVYRSANHSTKDVSQVLEALIDVDKPTLISGDFNLCTKKNRDILVTSLLLKKGFLKMLERPTHIQGGHIDHTYWLDRHNEMDPPEVEFYSPYWTDHDAQLVTLMKRYFVIIN